MLGIRFLLDYLALQPLDESRRPGPGRNGERLHPGLLCKCFYEGPLLRCDGPIASAGDEGGVRRAKAAVAVFVVEAGHFQSCSDHHARLGFGVGFGFSVAGSTAAYTGVRFGLLMAVIPAIGIPAIGVIIVKLSRASSAALIPARAPGESVLHLEQACAPLLRR